MPSLPTLAHIVAMLMLGREKVLLGEACDSQVACFTQGASMPLRPAHAASFQGQRMQLEVNMQARCCQHIHSWKDRIALTSCLHSAGIGLFCPAALRL